MVTKPQHNLTNKAGRLFVFEGPDDVGKTTLATMLSEHLSNNGLESEMLSFPGHEPQTVSELIYRLYHDPSALGVSKILPLTMQVMVTAAHIEVVEARVKPLMNAGVHVVLDRFWWSTWVYATLQGVSERARDLMIELEMQSWMEIRPDCIFLVLRREPLLVQPANHRWPELVNLYMQLGELQKQAMPVRLVMNDGSLSDSFEEVISNIQSTLAT